MKSKGTTSKDIKKLTMPVILGMPKVFDIFFFKTSIITTAFTI
jgi:hypothetical protein